MCFSPHLGIGCVGGGGGSPNGVVHNLLMQFFALYSSKTKVSETYFFDIMTTHNDQPRYVKHVLRHIYVFFTPFGDWVWGGGGSPNGVVHNLLMQLFALYSSKTEVLPNLFF